MLHLSLAISSLTRHVFLQGDADKCIDVLLSAGRIPEAAFFARSYAPSHIPAIMTKWKVELAKVRATLHGIQHAR